MTDEKLDPSVLLKDVPQPHRVSCDGQRDMSFQGWKLSESCVTREGQRSSRQTCVSIFVTIGGKYVVQVFRTKWDPGESEERSFDATVTESADNMLAFLMDSNRGSFGQASRDAWNEACLKFPPLAPFATETID